MAKHKGVDAEAGQCYVVNNPDALDARIGDYLFKAMWWGHVPPQDWSNEQHAHIYCEFAYVTQGHGEFNWGGRAFPLERGSVVIALPGDEHCIRSRRDGVMGMDFIAYDVGLAGMGIPAGREQAGLDRQVRAILSCNDRIRGDGHNGDLGLLFGVMRRSMECRFPGWHEVANAVSRAMILAIARLFAPLESPVFEKPAVGVWDWLNWAGEMSRDKVLIYRINDYVIRNCRKNLRIEDVSRATGVSVRKIQRRLDVLGYSFRTLLHAVRLGMAKFLLISTDLSAEDVTHQVGLAQVSYFSKSFKDKYGISPARYRAMREQVFLPGDTRKSLV